MQIGKSGEEILQESLSVLAEECKLVGIAPISKLMLLFWLCNDAGQRVRVLTTVACRWSARMGDRLEAKNLRVREHTVKKFFYPIGSVCLGPS